MINLEPPWAKERKAIKKLFRILTYTQIAIALILIASALIPRVAQRGYGHHTGADSTASHVYLWNRLMTAQDYVALLNQSLVEGLDQGLLAIVLDSADFHYAAFWDGVLALRVATAQLDSINAHIAVLYENFHDVRLGYMRQDQGQYVYELWIGVAPCGGDF